MGLEPRFSSHASSIPLGALSSVLNEREFFRMSGRDRRGGKATLSYSNVHCCFATCPISLLPVPRVLSSVIHQDPAPPHFFLKSWWYFWGLNSLSKLTLTILSLGQLPRKTGGQKTNFISVVKSDFSSPTFMSGFFASKHFEWSRMA